MNDYTTAACSACNQAIYIAGRKLEAPSWVCPACRAENKTENTRRPA